MEKLFDEKYGGVVDDLAKLVIDVEDKSFAEIVSSFDSIVTKVFEDGLYNNGRWIAVELFAQRLAERAAKIYATRLDVAFAHRLKEEEQQSFLRWFVRQAKE